MLRSVIVFVKQKTAYEMRISDWSSDVCSSDLFGLLAGARGTQTCRDRFHGAACPALAARHWRDLRRRRLRFPCEAQDFQRRRGQPLLRRPSGADLRRTPGQVGLVPRPPVPIQAVGPEGGGEGNEWVRRCKSR